MSRRNDNLEVMLAGWVDAQRRNEGEQVLFGVRSPDLAEVAGEPLNGQVNQAGPPASRTPDAPVDGLISFVHVHDVARSQHKPAR